jgi:hypothetical protein
MTIEHIHVFEFRNKAFKNNDVLQENIIFHATKGVLPVALQYIVRLV